MRFIMSVDRISRLPLRKAAAGAALAVLLTAASMASHAITPIAPMTIPAAITISDAVENVKFAGVVSVQGKVIDDPVFNSAQVIELVIDFSNVIGVGDKTGKQFVTDAQAVLHRPLRAADQVEVTFPYYLDSDPSVSRTAIAVFQVSFSGANNVGITMKFKPAGF
jgi:hypothetical protein